MNEHMRSAIQASRFDTSFGYSEKNQHKNFIFEMKVSSAY